VYHSAPAHRVRMARNARRVHGNRNRTASPSPFGGKDRTPAAASEHLHHLIEQIELADQVGLDIYGVGEHHRQEFLDSAPTIIMGVRWRGPTYRDEPVTVLSAADLSGCSRNSPPWTCSRKDGWRSWPAGAR